MIAFDASHQRDSGGEPPFVEHPGQRVEDFRQVVDYLVTLPYVDADKVGVLGIGGGVGRSATCTLTKALVEIVARGGIEH